MNEIKGAIAKLISIRNIVIIILVIAVVVFAANDKITPSIITSAFTMVIGFLFPEKDES